MLAGQIPPVESRGSQQSTMEGWMSREAGMYHGWGWRDAMEQGKNGASVWSLGGNYKHEAKYDLIEEVCVSM